MGTKTERQLEQLAVDAHRRGLSWGDFWADHAAEITQAEPDYFRRGQVIHRLVALVVSGDTDGQRPAGDRLPWSDSEPPCYPPSDNATVARLLWQPGQEAQP